MSLTIHPGTPCSTAAADSMAVCLQQAESGGGESLLRERTASKKAVPGVFTCPFRIIVDTAEQAPFSFEGLTCDAARDHRPLIVQTEFRSLRRFPDSLGDYTFEGEEKGELVSGFGRCHVERKSKEDCQSTVLGFSDNRRERFEKELENLAAIESGLVIVECTLTDLLSDITAYGSRTPEQIARTLHRSILAYQQDYRVPWHFAGSRRRAEKDTFLWLNRFWEKLVRERRRQRKADRREEILNTKLAAL